jgi:hypothetical protein
MKQNVLLLLCVFVFSNLFSGVIVIDGYYQNKNVYVQNAISSSGVGFCVYEVRVNGELSTDEVNTSAFEIDFSQFNIHVGAPVTILIKHKDDGCFPRVLNPEVLKPNPTFETVFISVENNGLLKWTTVNEMSKLPFIIEQFKWNKWVQIGEVQGKGTPTTNDYSFQTTPIAGVNKFRVKQRGYIDKVKFSPSVYYSSSKKDVSYIYIKKKQAVEFSEPTFFEVYDKFGTIVKKGYGKAIDIANLGNDVYYMNLENSSTEFRKK